MKGNNTFLLNQATICEAVEYWLRETQFQEGAAPRVTSVTSDSPPNDLHFKVHLEEKEE